MYLSETKSELFVDLLISEVERLRNRTMELESSLSDQLARETNPAPRNPYNKGLSSLIQGADADKQNVARGYEEFKPQRHEQ